MAKAPSPDPGFGALLGIDMVERGHARSVCRVEVRPDHLNPHGVVHGGVMYSMADQGMGAAVYSVIDEHELCATIEIKMVYLAPVSRGVLECVATVVSRGKRIAVLEAEVRNGDRLVAKALGTYAIFEPSNSQPAQVLPPPAGA